MTTTPRPLRLAILEADSPLPETTANYGSYGGVFTRLLHLASPSPLPDITTYNIHQHQHFPSPTALESLDAVIITGSRANAFDDTPWIVALTEFVKKLLHERKVKVIGICFGHQILGRALSLPVLRGEKGWEASVCTVPLVARGKELFGKDNLKLFQMHKDIVLPPLPAGIENLGESSVCALQGMVDDKEKRFVSVQGHPEFTREIVTELLTVRRGLGIFTEEEYVDMMSRVGEDHDGVEVMRAMLGFVRVEKV